MLSFVGGIAVFVVTAVIFWACLPRNGKSPFRDTPWDPYIAVGFSTGFTLSVMAIAVGVADLIG